MLNKNCKEFRYDKNPMQYCGEPVTVVMIHSHHTTDPQYLRRVCDFCGKRMMHNSEAHWSPLSRIKEDGTEIFFDMKDWR